MAVELFKDSRGNVCLALLAKDATSTTYAWNSYANTASNSTSINGNMYGTSTMRSIVLNNGGRYATSKTDTALSGTATQSSSNIWAKYTMSTSQLSTSVRDYLVTPYYTYQKNDTVPTVVLNDWPTQNQFFNTTCEVPSNFTYNSIITNNGYTTGTFYQNWKNDYVWLPSLQEMGRPDASLNGRWGLSSTQFSTGARYWSRTSANMYGSASNLFSNVRTFSSTGADTTSEFIATSKYAIRPCIFLNLTAAEAASTRQITTPSDVSATYTGSDLTSKFTSANWYNANQMTITYDKTRYNYTTVGNHVATVTAKSGYSFGTNQASTVNVTLTIGKAAVTAPVNKSYTYDGKEHKFETESWYNSSIMTITPTESDYNYTDVRLYTATVTLTNTNYYFSGLSTSLTSTSVSISITKKIIQKPNVQDVVYDGQKHGFKTRAWWDSNLMTLSLTDEQDDAIIDAGTYRATLSLPNDNYRWSDGDSKDTEVVTTIHAKTITPNDINLEYDGQEHKDSELTKHDWFDNGLLTAEFEDGKNYTDAGNYKITLNSIKHPNVVFAGNPNTTSWEINLTITKKQVNVQRFEVDENGELLSTSALALSENIYERDEDTDKAPVLALQYSSDGTNWTSTVPTHAGKYFVQAYITNSGTSNYVLADTAKITFEKSKGLVYMPRFSNDDVVAGNNGATILPRTIYGWTTQIRYTGQEQVFKLFTVDGGEPTRINIGTMTGGLQYNADTKEFRATDVGVYTVNITVKDPANEQWDNHEQNLSSIRTITLEILKCKIEYQIVDDEQNSWQAGDVQNIDIIFKGTDFTLAAKRPIITVYAGEQNSAVEIEKNDTNYAYSEEKLVVSVNISSYRPNQYYEILVELDNRQTINKNYELISIGSTITGDAYEFFITTAVIKNLEIEWLYSNPAVSTGITANGAGETVQYNEYEYHFKLNEMLLPNGISVVYANDKFTDANTVQNPSYKTTATLTASDSAKFDVGFAAIDSSIVCRYVNDKTVVIEIDWTITPTNFDLKILTWLDDFSYNKINQTMDLANCPSWIKKSDAPGGTNYATAVGEYIAKYKLSPDGNHKFVNESHLDWIDVQADGSAIVMHVWHINKIVIQVSDREEDWNFISAEDEALNWYEYPVPNALREYSSQLVVTYYNDANFEDKIDDITKITVPLQKEVWLYAKVELSTLISVTDLYEITNIYDTSKNYAYLTFKVGDRRNLLEVTLNFDENGTVYNGQSQEVIVTCPDLDLGRENFVVKYYTVDESGNSIPMADGELPTNAGNYLVAISFVENSPFDSSYNIKNKRFNLVIHKIKLVVESWTDQGGLELPEYIVVAEHDNTLDVSGYYSTFVSDLDGIDAPNPLKYNTNYKVVLSSNNDNVEFADDTEFEHIFKTGLNPAGDYIELERPELLASSLVWNNQEQTFEIVDWDRLQEYLEFAIDCDSLTQKNVGNYVVTLKFKENANATWLDGTTDSVSLAFEITKRHVSKPMTANEDGSILKFKFNGLNAEYFPDDFKAEWMIAENNVVEALGTGSMTIKLLDKDSLLWDDETIDDLTDIAFEVIARDIDRPLVSQIENKTDYVYMGQEIVFNAERDLVGYDARFMTISGELTGTNANYYTITISLIYKEYTYWNDLPLPEPPEEEVLPETEQDPENEIDPTKILKSVGSTEDLQVEWQIFKATIVGEWIEENNVPVFVPEDETQKDLFDTKYFAVDENGEYKLDENGNKIEVSPDNMVEGEKYKAEIVLKDANNYEVSGTDEVEIENEKEFEYKKNKNFFQKAWEFVKKHWLWFAIGLGALLLLLLLIIIIVVVKRRKKKEEELEEQSEETEETKEEQENKEEQDNKEENKEEVQDLNEEKVSDKIQESANLNSSTASANDLNNRFAGNGAGSAMGNMGAAVGGGGTYIFMNGQPMQGQAFDGNNSQSAQQQFSAQPQQQSTMQNPQNASMQSEQAQPRYGAWMPTQDANVVSSSDVDKLLGLLLDAYQNQEMKIRDDMQNLDFRQGELHDYGVGELRKHEMTLMEEFRREERRLEALREERLRMERREERRREEQRQDMLREERRREERRQEELREERRREERRQEQLREERLYEERLREERRRDEMREEERRAERRREERKQEDLREERKQADQKMLEKTIRNLKNKKNSEDK